MIGVSLHLSLGGPSMFALQVGLDRLGLDMTTPPGHRVNFYLTILWVSVGINLFTVGG